MTCNSIAHSKWWYAANWGNTQMAHIGSGGPLAMNDLMTITALNATMAGNRAKNNACKE